MTEIIWQQFLRWRQFQFQKARQLIQFVVFVCASVATVSSKHKTKKRKFGFYSNADQFAMTSGDHQVEIYAKIYKSPRH